MADMYRYGGVKLAQVPAMPDGCSYGMIFYDEEDACYYWFCSSEMFFLDGEKYMIPASTSYGGNAAKEGASAWNAATFTPEESEEEPDYYIVANTGNIVWTSVDICQKDSDTVVFPTTKPLQYPTITFTGSSKLYCIGAAADSLVCNATVNDGGTLSWAWYEGETVVGTENSFTPPTDALGEKSYYCVVTNTTEGELLTTTSGTVTIRVRDFFPIRGACEWLIAGLCSRPLPVSVRNKVPVAYLYNGVRLPDINAVWTDKEKYPYAVISDTPGFANSGIGYQLMVSSSPTEITSSGTRYFVSNAVVKEYMIFAYNEEVDATLREEEGISLKEYVAMAFGMELDVWTFVTEFDNYEAGFAIDSNPTRWANHDILSEDGTVYLAASDPVPVYE